MQISENLETTNKFRLFEKMETANSAELPKQKSRKNKLLNNSDSELNHEPQNNSVELPRDQSQ